jgi:hypothetical protein
MDGLCWSNDGAIFLDVDIIAIFRRISKVAVLAWQAVTSVAVGRSSTFVPGTSNEGAKRTSRTDRSPAISNEKVCGSQLDKASSKTVKLSKASFEGIADC